MKVDKPTPINTAAAEVSRQSPVGTLQSKAGVRRSELGLAESTDTVQTNHGNLVKLVLEEYDKTSEVRLAHLREMYESGTYPSKAPEIAHAILTGVLAGY